MLCSALVKAAINQAIWFPSSFKPEGTSVVAADHALTLVSSVLLSALLGATTSSEIGGLRVAVEVSLMESLMCFLTPWNRLIFEVSWAPHSWLFFWGIEFKFGSRCPPT